MQGRVSSALKNLTSGPCVGVHKINDDAINTLKQIHGKPSPILENTLLNDPVNEVLPCYFDNIDEELVSKASSLTKGADRLSQLDAMQYHHLLSSCKYKVENKKLKTKIAILTLDPLVLEAYLSCQLIPSG